MRDCSCSSSRVHTSSSSRGFDSDVSAACVGIQSFSLVSLFRPMTITVPFSPSRCYADVVVTAAVEFARLLLLLLYTPACTTYTCVGRGYTQRASRVVQTSRSIMDERVIILTRLKEKKQASAHQCSREQLASTHTHTYKIERLESQNFVLI